MAENEKFQKSGLLKFSKDQQSDLERLHFLESKIKGRRPFENKKDKGLTQAEYEEYEELQNSIEKYLSL